MSYKVTVRPPYFESEISDENAKEIAIKVLEKVCDFNSDYYINKDGRLCWEEEFHTSHVEWTNHVLRKATERDKFLVDVFKAIRNSK